MVSQIDKQIDDEAEDQEEYKSLGVQTE